MTKRTIDERSPSPLEEWEAGPRMPDIDGGAATSERNNGAATSEGNNGAAAGGSLLRRAVYFGSPTSVVDVLNTKAQQRSPNDNSPEPQGQFFEDFSEPQGPTQERKKESQVEKIMRFRRQLDEEKEKERLEKLEESLRKRKADDKEYDRRKLLAKEALQENPPSSPPESGFSIAPLHLPGRFGGNRKHMATEVGVEPDGHHERDENFTVLLTKLNEKENAAAKLSYEKYKQREKEEELQRMDKKRKAEDDEEKDGNQKDPHQGNGGDKDPGHGNGGGSSSKGNGGYQGSSSHGNGGYQRGAGGGYSQGR